MQFIPANWKGNEHAITMARTNKIRSPHSVYHWCGGHKINRIHSICLFFDSVNSSLFLYFGVCVEFLFFVIVAFLLLMFIESSAISLFLEWKIFIFIYFVEKSPRSVFVWVLFRTN